MAFCSACGREDTTGGGFCAQCGSPLTGGAPVHAPILLQPAPARDTPAGLSAIGGAWARFRGIPFIAQVCAVLVVLLIIGWWFFVRPMSTEEYTAKARAYVATIDETMADSETVWSEFWSSGSGAQAIDEYDLRDLKDGLKTNTALIREAANGIRWLRPPAEYETTQKRLEAYSNMLTSKWLWGEQDALDATKAGQTYDDLMARYLKASNTVRNAEDYVSATTAWETAKDRLGVVLEGD